MPQVERPRSSQLGRRGLVVFVAGSLLVACPKKGDRTPDPVLDAAAAVVTLEPTPRETSGDGAHGKDLVLTYQCNRCHDGTGHEAAARNKHCVHCHQDIVENRFQAPPKSLVKWKPRVRELADAPSLEALGKRVTRRWLEEYLLQPTDLRPHLVQSMPRLSLTAGDARDLAAYFVPEVDPPSAERGAPELAGADLGKGRQLLEAKGCGSCHVFTGVAPLVASAPPVMDGRDFERARKLAPDLRVVRDRTTPARLISWIKDPKSVKPDTAMPTIALSGEEVRDLAAYVLSAEITPPASKPNAVRLPPLSRKVTFKEVDEKVFHRTCWHCHSEPDYAIGDGGPGNSGGFGFKPRGLNLSDYSGIAAGFLDDTGQRSSVFTKDGEGVPRLVRALLARHDEEAGARTGSVRGMPLGYPALSLEDIQLVDSWILQGRPR